MAKNVSIGLCVSVCLLASAIVIAQEKDQLRVVEINTCTGVENREPVGVDSTFSQEVERVYCYTIFEGAQSLTEVTHVWYHGDEQRAEVGLTVQPGTWRTWSSKRIVPEWTGEWQVDVVADDGTVLKTVKFVINEQ